ncbi:Fluconazole resistance protein 1 [Clarireedia jacksonii]
MAAMPTSPMDDSSHAKRTSKASKQVHRSLKRASTSPDSSSSTLQVDGRHKRVWKACERCRMKKTKCDGESPCKRCRDDAVICTAGSRKKTEFKTLPRGYAEVLENTQYALISAVHKLYLMVRNNEPWELGEPELNDRGQPVIHDIASKLGCIRPSPDLPLAFAENPEELHARLESDASKEEETRTRKSSESEESSHSHSSPMTYTAPEYTPPSSSCGSDHSDDEMANTIKMEPPPTVRAEPTPRPVFTQPINVNILSSMSAKFSETRLFTERNYENRRQGFAKPMPPRISTNYYSQTDSPISSTSPFPNGFPADDFMGPPHPMGFLGQPQSFDPNMLAYDSVTMSNLYTNAAFSEPKFMGSPLSDVFDMADGMDFVNFNNVEYDREI